MKAVVYLVLATLFWAGNYVVGETAVKSMEPLALTWWRWAFAVVPLLVLAHVVERPDWRAVAARWRILLAMGCLGMGAYALFLYGSLQYTTAVNASLINAANPALIVVFAVLLLRARPGRRGWAGVLLGLVGVLLVLSGGHLDHLLAVRFNVGDLLMLGAITVWALYTVLGRRVRLPAIASTAAQVVFALAAMAPFAAVFGVPLPAGAPGWASLGFVVLFPSIGSYLLWNAALRTVAPGSAGMFLNLITVFTALAAVLLGRPLAPVQVLGGVVVLGGMVLTSLAPRGRTTPQPPAGSAIPARPPAGSGVSTRAGRASD